MEFAAALIQQRLFAREIKMTDSSQCETDLSCQSASTPRAGSEPSGFFRALRICYREKYWSYEGRASRSEFWTCLVGAALLWLGIVPLAGLAQLTLEVGADGVLMFVFLFCHALGIVLFVHPIPPILGAILRRFHDVGLPGWAFFAICLLPFVVSAYVSFGVQKLIPLKACPEPVFYLVGFAIAAIFCWPGKRGPNKYGPAPGKES
jgi:uncharacterized membrane protein YhaH (DUF805 family)